MWPGSASSTAGPTPSPQSLSLLSTQAVAVSLGPSLTPPRARSPTLPDSGAGWNPHLPLPCQSARDGGARLTLKNLVEAR